MDELIRFVRSRFKAMADPPKARDMAAYMKTDMPFYGVQKPNRVLVYREATTRFPITARAHYVDAIQGLWSQPHREEKYLAIQFAMGHPRFITLASLPLYRRLILEGAWWDFVDDISIRLVGRVVLQERAKVRPIMDRWVDSPGTRNMWLRRSAIISHISHGEQTDQRQLFGHCLRRCDEKEFFIRKAIGWSLRHYARTAPKAVCGFLMEHRDELSPLSFREAGKHLNLGS